MNGRADRRATRRSGRGKHESAGRREGRARGTSGAGAPRISFLGAARTVTGSKYLLSAGGRNYLIECGLFQGPPALEQRNWSPFPLSPGAVDAVVLSHAHIDHTGYLPRLVAEGYRGPVYTTEATAELLRLLLPDSGHLQEEQAEYANRKGYSRHRPALPLYTAQQAVRSLRNLRPAPPGEPIVVDDRLTVRFHRAGHILGSAIVECVLRDRDQEATVVFSGDLGRHGQPVMTDPTTIPHADYLIVESTYGDREHSDDSVPDRLAEVVASTAARGGVLVIPAFAIGRTQEVLYHLRELEETRRIPSLPVYVDSPMATDATDLYCRFGDDHNLRVDLLMEEQRCPLRCRETHFVRDAEQSKRLNTRPGPFIVISASGMCSGGRVVHHLKHRLPDPRNTVLFVGYQAAGTRGRALRDGARRVRIHGGYVPVRARVAVIDGLSAHAGRSDLLRWLRGFERPPRETFVVHGEPEASLALAEALNRVPAGVPRSPATAAP